MPYMAALCSGISKPVEISRNGIAPGKVLLILDRMEIIAAQTYVNLLGYRLQPDNIFLKMAEKRKGGMA